jgi:RNA polymerase sigma factor (TIGR02999 family)
MNETATQIVLELERGDTSKAERLFSVVYDDLRRLAARQMQLERVGHTLQPTALVHEVFLRLVDGERITVKGRTYFLALAAQVMRRILVSHARAHKALKRGKGLRRVTLDSGLSPSGRSELDILALEDALARLAEVDSRQARVVELRFFAGLNLAEVGEALGAGKRTVERDWTMARAWLMRELKDAKAE